MNVRKIISALVLGAAPLSLVSLSASAATVLPSEPAVSAHRGATNVPAVPENTHAALRYALDNGARAYEMDVRFTKGGGRYMLHDTTLDRTTNCTGVMETMTYEQLKVCKVDGTPNMPPSLRSILRVTRNHKIINQIEVKPIPGHPLSERRAKALVDVFYEYGVQGRTLISSSSVEYLKMMNRLDTRGQIKFSTQSNAAAKPMSVTAIKATGSRYYMPHHKIMTRALVANYQKNGIEVWAWPAKTETDYVAIKSDGANVIVPDDVRKYNAWTQSK